MKHDWKTLTKSFSVIAMFFCFFWGLSICRGPLKADQLSELTRPIPGRSQRASSGEFDPESNRDSFHPEPGQRLILADLEGPGEIRHIWFTTMSRNRRAPRALMLRIYYDGSKIPSVETPLGDFFAAGNGMKANVKTKPIEVSSYGRALNCYWRMPFRKGCRIEIHNQGPERATVYFQCDWLKLDSLPKETMYFHARYRQEYPAKPFSVYTVFEGKGEGHYVGTVFSSQNNLMSWFGEADDRFYIDGEPTPSLVGTGTEDYFNDAWNLRLTSGNRVGTTICEPKGKERRITAYRWHIDDPITFKKSLKMTIERRSFMAAYDPATGIRHSYDFKYRPDYWSSVAFWYQKGIAEILWDIPGYEKRILPEIWVEPTQLVKQTRTSPGLEPKSLYNRACNLKRYFYIRNDKVGSWFELPFTVKQKGRYAISILPNLYKEHGVWKISLVGPDNETTLLDKGFDMWDYRVSRAEDWPENFEHGTTVEATLGVHHLEPGDYRFRFECVGANPLTRHPDSGEFGKGYSIGLDSLNLRLLPIEYPYAWIQEYLKEEEVLFAKRDKLAADTVQKLQDAINRYHHAEGEYPESLDKLYASKHWDGEKNLRDPWEQKYQYRMPGVVDPWSFDVWSFHGRSQNPPMWIGNWATPFKAGSDNKAIVLEGEDLQNAVTRTSDGIRAISQSVQSWRNAPFSNHKSLLIQTRKKGDWAEIQLSESIPSGTYEVSLALPTSWNYGIVRWSLGETILTPSINMYTETIGATSTPPVKVELTDDPRSRVLRVETLGKIEFSPGYYTGLDAVVLKAL